MEYTGAKKSSQTQTILGVHAQSQTEAQLTKSTSTSLPLEAVPHLDANAMGAGEKIKLDNFVNLAPTHVVLSENMQSNSSTSTNHFEEASARFDGTPKSCASSRVLASEKSAKCERQGKGLEAPQIPHTFRDADARYLGSGSPEVMVDCPEGILSISRSTNKSEIKNNNSDEDRTFLDTKSRVGTRASGYANKIEDTRYYDGSLMSMPISCTAEQAASSASRTIRSECPGAEDERSLEAVAQGICYNTVPHRDGFKFSSPSVETPLAPERTLGTVEAEKSPEPKRVVLSVAEKEQKDASPTTPLNIEVRYLYNENTCKLVPTAQYPTYRPS